MILEISHLMIQIILGLIAVLCIVILVIIFSYIFVSWYGKYSTYKDKYEHFKNVGYSEEDCKEKAEWHTR